MLERKPVELKRVRLAVRRENNDWQICNHGLHWTPAGCILKRHSKHKTISIQTMKLLRDVFFYQFYDSIGPF
jgi:hypothetical protein